jgi:hypothetical protein
VRALFLGSTLLLAGCKSYEAVPAAASTEESKPEPPTDRPMRSAVPPPADSRLSTVAREMTLDQVEEVAGSPTSRSSYPTAGTYNPFGSDSGNRVVYKYKGEGRVLFRVPKNGESMRVLRVDYDPTEDGN